MGKKVDLSSQQANIQQALKNKEVRKAINEQIQNNTKLNDGSVWRINGNTVEIDLEGDGAFDYTVDNLVTENGEFNTKGLKVKETAVSTRSVAQMNENIKLPLKLYEEAEKAYEPYKGNLDAYSVAESTKDTQLANDYKNLKQELRQVEEQLAQLKSETTTGKGGIDLDLIDKQNALKEQKNEIESKLNQLEQQYQQEKELYLNKKNERFNEYKEAIDRNIQFLVKHGYSEEEARKLLNLKADDIKSERGVVAGKELSLAEQVESAAKTYVSLNTELAKLCGDDYTVKYDDETGSVKIFLGTKAGDGDNHADFVISNIVDLKTGTINFNNAKFAPADSDDSTAVKEEYKTNLESLKSRAKSASKKLDKTEYNSIQQEIYVLVEEIKQKYPQEEWAYFGIAG